MEERRAPDMAIQLSDKEQKMVQDLKDLLQFGSEKLKSIPVGWYSIGRRKKILLQMFAAVHSQTESINILLETGRTFSVEVLLRPIQVTLINANYILVGRNNLTANRFLVGSNNKLISQISKMVRYHEQNPTHNTGTPLLDLKALKEALTKRQRENKSYLAGFPYRIPTKEPSVEERVIAIDKEFLRLRRKLPLVSQQWMYLTQYWLASEQVHLSARGLLSYVVAAEDSVVLLLDGDKKELEKCIYIATAMYLDMLYIISSQFKVPVKKELKPWRDKLIANSKNPE